MPPAAARHKKAAQAAAEAGGNLVAMKAWDGGKSKLGVRIDERVERTRALSLKSRVFTVKGRVSLVETTAQDRGGCSSLLFFHLQEFRVLDSCAEY